MPRPTGRAKDGRGLLRGVMEECVDGEARSFKAKGGAYTREHFFGKYPELKAMVANMSLAQWSLLIDTHVTGTFNFCQAALRHMVPRQSGAIVITSITSIERQITDDDGSDDT